MKKILTRALWNIALFSFLTFVVFGTFNFIASRLPETPEVTARRMKTMASIQIKQHFDLALIPYRLDVGNYPSSDENLNALIQAPIGKEKRWKGPYLDNMANLTDPWGNPYQYLYPGKYNIHGSRGYDLWSWGPDGVRSDDDIKNWNEPRS